MDHISRKSTVNSAETPDKTDRTSPGRDRFSGGAKLETTVTQSVSCSFGGWQSLTELATSNETPTLGLLRLKQVFLLRLLLFNLNERVYARCVVFFFPFRKLFLTWRWLCTRRTCFGSIFCYYFSTLCLRPQVAAASSQPAHLNRSCDAKWNGDGRWFVMLFGWWRRWWWWRLRRPTTTG